MIGIWAFWCSFNADYPGFFQFADWAFTGDAFKKALTWAMCWELFGFGCGWGPMNARYEKWFGGCRHFARIGTIKLPLFRGAPLIGGDTRNALDVAVYVVTQVLLLRALVAPEVTAELLLPCFVLVAVNGILDKTLFLVARYEHYWVVMGALVFAAEGDLWVAGEAHLVFHLDLGRGVEMESPFPLRDHVHDEQRALLPEDPQASALRGLSERSPALEIRQPDGPFRSLLRGSDPDRPLRRVRDRERGLLLGGCILFTGFHSFIGLNNPNGMPVEWNILMIYGGWNLFWFHPEIQILDLTQMPLLFGAMLFSLVAVPLFGELRAVSGLLPTLDAVLRGELGATTSG